MQVGHVVVLEALALHFLIDLLGVFVFILGCVVGVFPSVSVVVMCLYLSSSPYSSSSAFVRLAFRPEFLNRIDEILLFNRLVLDDMKSIVQIQLARLERLLEERRIHLTVDDAGKEWLAQKGYDPVYGARPLRRVIQRELQNPLASLILEGKVQDRISVTAKEGELILSC